MTVPDEVSPTARALAERLLTSGRRFTAAQVRDVFAEVSPWSVGLSDRHWMLARALDELAAAGFLECSERREREGSPVPSQVRLRPSGAVVPTPARPFVWHPELSVAADLPGPPDDRLLAVNRWLFRGGTDAEEIAVRERAIDLGLDEKAFDRLGAVLTLDILRAYRPVPPLYRKRVGDGPILLVVENWTTFDSILRALSDDPGPVGELGWGAGRAFTLSVLSLHDRPPVTVRYFGDLDPEGLRIPAAASVSAEDEGLPPVRPAHGLYDLLLAREKRGGHPPVRAEQARRLAEWLDPALRDRAVGHLTSGFRLAQEAVNRIVLVGDGAWRTTLANL